MNPAETLLITSIGLSMINAMRVWYAAPIASIVYGVLASSLAMCSLVLSLMLY